jgi:hypothetical protein
MQRRTFRRRETTKLSQSTNYGGGVGNEELRGILRKGTRSTRVVEVQRSRFQWVVEELAREAGATRGERVIRRKSRSDCLKTATRKL